MFQADLSAIFRKSFMPYAAHVSNYLLDFLHVIKLLFCLQFLNSTCSYKHSFRHTKYNKITYN